MSYDYGMAAYWKIHYHFKNEPFTRLAARSAGVEPALAVIAGSNLIRMLRSDGRSEFGDTFYAAGLQRFQLNPID